MNTLLLLFSYFPSSFRSRASSRETFFTSNGASLSLSLILRTLVFPTTVQVAG